MNSETIALVGGIGGSVIGLLGGLFGTYMSIRNSKTPQEKALMVRASIVVWALLTGLIIVPLFLTVTGVFPRWGFWPTAVVFFILVGPMIREINKRQIALRGGIDHTNRGAIQH
jgi:drug/metabolite transporter (DMT)-like permease